MADRCQSIIDAIERLPEKRLELEGELNGATGQEITQFPEYLRHFKR